MVYEVYHLLRSRQDGRYLAARQRSPDASEGAPTQTYVLVFREHADALSYLNTHAPDVATSFAVESVPSSQLSSVLQGWSFTGFGVVGDPLLPTVEFFRV